jgi:hypothetical protein
VATIVVSKWEGAIDSEALQARVGLPKRAKASSLGSAG